MAQTDFDIVILGGGPTGGVLACLANQLGWRTALIDPRDPDVAIEPDSRAFAVVRGGWHVLRAAGVAAALEADAELLTGMEAHEHSRSGDHDAAALFGFDDLKDDPDSPGLGRLVEVDKLFAAIDAQLAAADGLSRIAPSRFRDITNNDGGALIETEDGRTITSELVVAADGAGSPARERIGLPVQGWSYDQSVFAVTVQLEDPHGGVARQWFQPEGPFAMLPLTGNRGNVAWFRTRAAAEATRALSDADIETELNHRFSHLCGPMTLLRAPLTYPLQLQFAERMISDRFVLAGDAARRISPLAGQGFNLALKDIAALLEVLESGRAVGLPVHDGTMLERYQSWRRFDGIGTALAMDMISRTYSNSNAVLKPLRRIALDLTNRVDPLRKLLAQQASAALPGLPKLVRGEPLGSISLV